MKKSSVMSKAQSNRCFGNVVKSAAVIAMLGAASLAHAGKKHPSLVGVFPEPSCNVTTAARGLEYNLSQIGQPTWDGNLPWPLMVGYWRNALRDLYVTVSVEEIPQSEFGRIIVTFRSICGYQAKGNDNYLAYGAKVVTEADFRKSELTLPLRNFGLSGESLVAVLEIVTDDPQAQLCLANSKLRITVRDRDAHNSLVTRDAFVAERLLGNAQ